MHVHRHANAVLAVKMSRSFKCQTSSWANADVTWLQEVGVDNGLMLITKQKVFVVPGTPVLSSLSPTPEAEQHGVKNNNTLVSTILWIMSKVLQPLVVLSGIVSSRFGDFKLCLWCVSAVISALHKSLLSSTSYCGWNNFHRDPAGLSRNFLPRAMRRGSGILSSCGWSHAWNTDKI